MIKEIKSFITWIKINFLGYEWVRVVDKFTVFEITRMPDGSFSVGGVFTDYHYTLMKAPPKRNWLDLESINVRKVIAVPSPQDGPRRVPFSLLRCSYWLDENNHDTECNCEHQQGERVGEIDCSYPKPPFPERPNGDDDPRRETRDAK